MRETAKKILVVDDDAYVRALVIKLLQRKGFAALPAADAWQAMDLLQQQDVYLIILDLRMPGPVDGEQLLFTLRDQGNDIAVVVLSGWVDDEISDNPPDCVHAVLKNRYLYQHGRAGSSRNERVTDSGRHTRVRMGVNDQAVLLSPGSGVERTGLEHHRYARKRCWPQALSCPCEHAKPGLPSLYWSNSDLARFPPFARAA